MAIPTQEEAPGGSKGGEEEAIHGGRITYYLLCDSWNPQTQESIIDIAYTSWSIYSVLHNSGDELRQDVVNQFWAALINLHIATFGPSRHSQIAGGMGRRGVAWSAGMESAADVARLEVRKDVGVSCNV